MVTQHGRPPIQVLEGGDERRRDGCSTSQILVVLFALFVMIILGSYLYSKEVNNRYSSSLNVNLNVDYHIIPDDKIQGDVKRPNKLTEHWKFNVEVRKISFLKDCNRLFYEDHEGIKIMTFVGMNITLLVSNEQIHKLLNDSANKQCSFDCRFIALSTDIDNPSTNPEFEQIYVNVMDVKEQTLHAVGRSKDKKEAIRYLKWSPVGEDFIFAKEGQLYYVAKPVLISNANEKNTTHGVFDWMTEEEIFSTREASWWSSRGDKIAYASRKLVSEPSITITAFRAEDQYQIETSLVYEKVGYKKLPVYVLSVWDKTSGVLKEMSVVLKENAFHYLFGVSWVRHGDKEVLAAVWANRWQNHTFITYCDFETAKCAQVYEEIYPPRTWAFPGEYDKLKSAKDAIFLILPREMPDGNVYQHVARVNVKTGEKKFLSMGNYDVNEIVYHDEAKNLLYFHTAAPRPTSYNLYVTQESMAQCVSCGVPNCSAASATLSPDGDRLVLNCKGPDMPRKYLGDLSSKGVLGKVREVLHDSKLEKLVKETALPRQVTEEITLDNGVVATTRLYLPRLTNLSSLPLLVYVYNGPGFQLLGEGFTVNKLDAWVMNMNIAVLKVDARGTGGRGWKYRSPVYGGLGTVEMEDQIKATQAILKKYPFFNTSRVALHGWSYGGFATIRIVQTAPKGLFKCAISGAPVTNFQYYDAAYTERYMGSVPKEGYVDLNKGDMSKFNSTRLMLIHGLADDNVHFQNSAVFSEELQKKQVDFDFMVYSNERHHPKGKKSKHLEMMMTSFIRKCLTE